MYVCMTHGAGAGSCRSISIYTSGHWPVFCAEILLQELQDYSQIRDIIKLRVDVQVDIRIIFHDR